MTTTKIIGTKSPTWVRALQIGIGAIAIGLSLGAMIFPVLAIAATFTVAAIILFLLGIEQIVGGIFLYKRSRLAHIGLGILVIILSSLIMVYPLASAALVVFLAAIALLFSGIASIIAGLSGGGKKSTGSKALAIGAGALAIVLSVAIMVSPVFGIALAGVIVGIALLAYGIRLVATGMSGRKEGML